MPTQKSLKNTVENCNEIYISKHALRPVVFVLLICSKYNKGYCIIPHAAQIILRGNNAFKVVFSDSKVFLN